MANGKSEARAVWSTILAHTGSTALAGSLAMAAGFWIAEIGVPWIPTMLGIITTACLAALVAMTAARFIGGGALRPMDKGFKMRKRVKTLLTLVVLIGVVRLLVHCMGAPSALTTLRQDDYEAVFTADSVRFNECDKGLADCRAALVALDNLFDGDSERTLTTEEERTVRQIWQKVYDYGFCLDSIHEFHGNWYRFDSARNGRRYHVRSFLLCFGADLVLYEHARAICDLIERNNNVVKFLNAPDPDDRLGEDSFSRFRNQLTNSAQSARIAAGIGYFLWLDKALSAGELSEQLGCGGLWRRTASGCSAVGDSSRIKQFGIAIGGDLELLKRTAHRSWFPLQKNVAEWMGHTRVHRPGAYLISDPQTEQIGAKLSPGDVLLSRKNWYLSNVGLPGFWPHAVFYVGNEQQLRLMFDGDPDTRQYIAGICGKEMDLCDYLSMNYPVKWHQYQIGDGTEGCRVIEAVSAGVVSHTLRQACGDYLAALRPNLPKAAKAAAIIEAFSHVGKPYDYEFDFATDHALVCTELVWRSYRPAESKEGLRLAPIDYAGRKTLPANEIARTYQVESDKGQDDRQFSFVLFYDASEESGKAFPSNENAFLASANRSKWSVQQD